MDLTGVLYVLDRNACRSCRRPIALIKNVGWLHDELPRYAGHELTCGKAAPIDPRCPHCDSLTSAVQTTSGLMLLKHDVGDFICPGSGATVAKPQ